MTYAWINLLVKPSELNFPLYALMVNHYRKDGGYFPVGGGSELAMSLIPIIERAGGKVLVCYLTTDGPKSEFKQKHGCFEFTFPPFFRSEPKLRRFFTTGYACTVSLSGRGQQL